MPDGLSQGALEAAMGEIDGGASTDPEVRTAPTETPTGATETPVEDSLDAELEAASEAAAEAAADLLDDSDVTMVKVDGRDIPMTREQLIEHAGRGYNHSSRNRELKEREEALQNSIDNAKQYQALLSALESESGTMQVLDLIYSQQGPSQAARQAALRRWASAQGLAGRSDEDLDDVLDDDLDSAASGAMGGQNREVAELRAQVESLQQKLAQDERRQQAETFAAQVDAKLDAHDRFFQGDRARQAARDRVQRYLQSNPGAGVEQAVAYALSERVQDLREAKEQRQRHQEESAALRTVPVDGSAPGATPPPAPPKGGIRSRAFRDNLTEIATGLLNELR